jgi:hypothetical protein
MLEYYLASFVLPKGKKGSPRVAVGISDRITIVYLGGKEVEYAYD